MTYTDFYVSFVLQFLSIKKNCNSTLQATKFYEISTLLLCTVHTNKSKMEISQNFVAFSEYINFNKKLKLQSSYFEVRHPATADMPKYLVVSNKLVVSRLIAGTYIRQAKSLRKRP